MRAVVTSPPHARTSFCWEVVDSSWLSFLQTRITQIIPCMIFLMRVATIQHLNYNWQESRKHKLQFNFLTHLTLIQGQGYQTYNDNVDLEQGYYYANFESSHFRDVYEKANVKGCCFVCFLVSNEDICEFFPLNSCKSLKEKKSYMFMICLTDLTILQIYNLIRWEGKDFISNSLTLLWLWNILKVTVSGMNG